MPDGELSRDLKLPMLIGLLRDLVQGGGLSDEEKAQVMQEFGEDAGNLAEQVKAQNELLSELTQAVRDLNGNAEFFRDVLLDWAESGKTGFGTLFEILREKAKEFSKDGE